MSNIFFASDMHFGHQNVISYCDRPFDSVEAMDEHLVSEWNRTVGKNDTVYHLGDWAFHNYHHIGRLNGVIYSVPGNHDHERMKKLLPWLPHGFLPEVVYLKIDKQVRFVLSHYPFESWRREYKYHLHGHTHGQVRQIPNRLDVGIDATGLMRPISLDEVLETLKGSAATIPSL